MLGALRRPIDKQNGSRRRNDVDDPDQRLLRHARGPRPREGQQHGCKQGEGKRIAIGRRALGGMAEHECHRRAERRDLRERQIDKDDFAGEDLDAEIGVDADQAYRHQERGPKECEGLGHRAVNADFQRCDIGVEQRDVVCCPRQGAYGGSEHDDFGARAACHELDVAFRLVGLTYDNADGTCAHGLDHARKMRRARGNAGFDLDETDEVQAKPAGKVRPAVVIGNKRRGVEPAQPCLPFFQLGVEPCEKCKTVGLVAGGTGWVDAHESLEDRAGDDLRVLGIEPIMRVAAAVSMTVAGTHAHATKLQHGDGERGIDIARTAASQLGLAGLRQQAIEPQIVVEPDAHHHAGASQPRARPAVWADSPRRPCSPERGSPPRFRSPPTASVRLRRSVVVVTTWMRSCANPGEARLSQRTVKARRNCMRLAMRKGRAMQPIPVRSTACRRRRSRPIGSSASGNARSSRYPRSPRPGNPSPRWRAHRHRAAQSSSRIPAT